MVVTDTEDKGAAILAVGNAIAIRVEDGIVLISLGAAGGAKVLRTRISEVGPNVLASDVSDATDGGLELVAHGHAVATKAHLGGTGVELVGDEIAVGIVVDELVEGILVGVGGVGRQDLRDKVVGLGGGLGGVVGGEGVGLLCGGLANTQSVTGVVAGTIIVADIGHVAKGI